MLSHRPASGQGARLPVPAFSPRGGHRHRDNPIQACDASLANEPDIEKSLLENRQKLSQAVATARAITTRRNQEIAEALGDGVLQATIVAATAAAPKTIRTIGLSIEDMLPQGAHPDAHIIRVSSTTKELQDAEDEKTSLKRQRNHLIATAHRMGIYDDYKIAALTGVSAQEVRRLIRGTGTRPTQNPDGPPAKTDRSTK